jgi:hypothetical protein
MRWRGMVARLPLWKVMRTLRAARGKSIPTAVMSILEPVAGWTLVAITGGSVAAR